MLQYFTSDEESPSGEEGAEDRHRDDNAKSHGALVFGVSVERHFSRHCFKK